MIKYKTILYQLIVKCRFLLNKSTLKKKKIWWRDDDSYELSKEFEKLLKFKEKMNIDVYLSVIPARITNSFINSIKNMKDVYVLPHGYMHTNHSKNGKKLNEFPKSRNKTEIMIDIRKSIEKLERCFPKKYVPVFVPPWEHFSEKVIPILLKYNIKALSLSGKKNAGKYLKSLNCDINFHEYQNFKDGNYKASSKSLITLCNEIIDASKEKNKNQFIGFMTHHKDMTDEDWNNYSFLLLSLKKLECVPFENDYFMNIIDGKR